MKSNVPRLLLAVAATLLVGAAQAKGPWHPSSGEPGASFHADHLQSDKQRGDVRAVLEVSIG